MLSPSSGSAQLLSLEFWSDLLSHCSGWQPQGGFWLLPRDKKGRSFPGGPGEVSLCSPMTLEAQSCGQHCSPLPLAFIPRYLFSICVLCVASAHGEQVTLCLGGITSRISKGALGLSHCGSRAVGMPELCSRQGKAPSELWFPVQSLPGPSRQVIY